MCVYKVWIWSHHRRFWSAGNRQPTCSLLLCLRRKLCVKLYLSIWISSSQAENQLDNSAPSKSIMKWRTRIFPNRLFKVPENAQLWTQSFLGPAAKISRRGSGWCVGGAYISRPRPFPIGRVGGLQWSVSSAGRMRSVLACRLGTDLPVYCTVLEAIVNRFIIITILR